MRKIFYVLFFISIALCCQAQDSLLNTTKLPPIYYDDDFIDNRNRWADFDHTMAKGYIKDGKFFFENKQPEDSYMLWETYNISPNRDYYIEMVFSKISGPEDLGNGMLFNHEATKKSNSCKFIITDAQEFKIYKRVNGESQDIQDWKSCSFIHAKGNNKLAVLAKGPKMYFYINDKLVYEMQRPEYVGSQIGFINSPATVLAIDKFTIRYVPLSINIVANAVHGYKKINLGDNINSSSSDNFPILSADGKLMFFSRSENLGKIGNDQRVLMYSEYNDNTKAWSLAKPLSAKINQGGKPQVIYISPDKNTLIVNATYDNNGKYVKNGELSVFHRTRDDWSAPRKVLIDGWSNTNEYDHYAFSSNNKVMLLSLQTKDGFGERDLYVSFKHGDIWTKPKNLGAVINSYSDDFSICLAPDNVTLYYSSFGKPGYGGSDVFVTHRLDDTWLHWSEPKNLGPEINNPFNNSGLYVDAYGQYAYMDAYETDAKKSDIYKIQLPESARPKPVVIVKGKVYNKVTKAPFSASIVYENLEKMKEEGIAMSSPKDGSFILILPYGTHYGLLATAKGYLSESKNIDLKDSIKKGFIEVNVDLYLTPLTEGGSLTLNSIFFEADKYELIGTSFLELDRLYHVMVENSQLMIEIEGHTDLGGQNSSEAELQTLSINRANAVKEYLVKKGIDPKRISTIGYGKSRPISTSNNAVNRRVEVKVIKM